MYPPQVLQHFEHPRNVGELERPTASARAENPVCGDILLLTLQAESGRITAARFRAQGCVATIAAGSAITELVTGLAVAEARALERRTLVAALGGLTPESMHASHLAMDALGAALRQLPGAVGR